MRRKGRKMATLGPGSFVGEMALLSKIPRVATVTARDAARRARDHRSRVPRPAREDAVARREGRPHARRARRRERAQRPASRQLTAWARSTRACASSRRLRTLPRSRSTCASGARDDARDVGRRRRRPRPDQHRGAPREVQGRRARPARDRDGVGAATIRTPTPRCAVASSRRSAARRRGRTSTRCSQKYRGRDYDPAIIKSERVILRIAPDVQHVR